MKRIGIVLLVIVVVGVIGLVAGVVWIDQLAKAGLERGATYALGVETRLGNMDVGIVSGRLEMDELSVANPAGFKGSHFLKLGSGRVAVSLGTLMSETVEIPELTLSGIYLNLEKKMGGANYDVIMAELDKFKSAETPAADPAPPATVEQKKFIIRKVRMEDVQIDVNLLGDLVALGDPGHMRIEIPPIELTDVGSEDNGVALAEVSGILVAALLDAVAKKAGDVLPGDMAREIQKGLGDLKLLTDVGIRIVGDMAVIDGEFKNIVELGRKASEDLGKASDDARNAIDNASKDIKDVVGGFGGLLKKPKGNANENDNRNANSSGK